MCKVCDKEIYFDTSWCYTDAGYGDTDEGGLVRNIVVPFICPACGKLKIKPVERLFGSVEKALVYLILQNMSEGSTKEEKLELFKKVLEESDSETCDKILENMGLTCEEGYFKHSCGFVIAKNVKVDSKILLLERLEKILSSKNMNYCPCCGKKIYPFNHNIDVEDSINITTFEVGRKKTWDNFLGSAFKPEKEFK